MYEYYQPMVILSVYNTHTTTSMAAAAAAAAVVLVVVIVMYIVYSVRDRRKIKIATMNI